MSDEVSDRVRDRVMEGRHDYEHQTFDDGEFSTVDALGLSMGSGFHAHGNQEW